MKALAAALPLLVVAFAPALAQDDLPYPKGSTSQMHLGMKFQLVVPPNYDPAKEHSLIVVLHGAGGTETGMAGSLAPLAAEGFVVCAPKSAGPTWTAADVKIVSPIHCACSRHGQSTIASRQQHSTDR